ncbi:UDP-4-amino-4,6-dideoxy-N-acetyl-beta-L-altrosamine N-acetyltransferase [Helicobacter sp. MIT 05-5293]|nr:UDP-4-amino-4,6-dideoxy-N-acetyl-beta-L-altrosamine N-acetyltransferase [Helicobacter sp. MIT 05-5293]
MPHNTPNCLESIDFTALNEDDSAFVLSMRNHPQIAPWMYSNAVSKESHLQFIANLRDDKTKRYWLLKREGEIIGVGSLTRINLTHKHAYIGIYKNPFSPLPHKGKQILDFLQYQAFDVLNLHTLHLEVLAINKQAITFYENMGYIKEGILNEFIHRDNRYYDVVLMYKKSIRNP